MHSFGGFGVVIVDFKVAELDSLEVRCKFFVAELGDAKNIEKALRHVDGRPRLLGTYVDFVFITCFIFVGLLRRTMRVWRWRCFWSHVFRLVFLPAADNVADFIEREVRSLVLALTTTSSSLGSTGTWHWWSLTRKSESWVVIQK